MRFDKHSLLKTHGNMKFLWSRQVNKASITTARFNQVSKNKLKIIDLERFEVIREIKLTQIVESVSYWKNNLFMIFDFGNKSPKYLLKTLDLDKNTFHENFYSSRMPLLSKEKYQRKVSSLLGNHLEG